MKKVLVGGSVMIKKQIVFCLILSLLTSNLCVYGAWPPEDIEIVPQNPSTNDAVSITVGGTWGDVCIPNGSDISVFGNDIYLNVIHDYPPGTVCATIPVGWAQAEFVGPLSPGTYNVYTTLNWAGDTLMTQFIVSDSGTLNLLSPDGGESLIAGTVHSVTWSSEGTITNVKLEYSDDNGAGWTVITASTANNGQYDWTVGEVTSGQCLVRVSDASDAGVNDESDGVFTMYVCLLDSPADANGDCKVNLLDLAMVAIDWLKNGNPFDPDYLP